MLTFIRSKTGSIITKGVVLFIILGFAVWGVQTNFFYSGPNSVVAKVGNEEISAYELQRSVDFKIREIQSQMKDPIPEALIKQFGIVSMALQEKIDEATYDATIKNLNLAPVSDERVRETIYQYPNFQAHGEFNRDLYEDTLRRSQLTEDQFIQLVRSDLTRQQLINLLVTGVSVPEQLVQGRLKFQNEKRVVDYVIINSDQQDVPTPNEDELKSHYTSTSTNYKKPEYRSVTVLDLSVKNLAETISVTDDEIQENYEANIASYTDPEKRKVDGFNITTKEKADQIYDLLKKGEPYAKISDQFLKDEDVSDNSLGFIVKEDLDEKTSKAIFSLENNSFTQPIENVFGWQIFRVTEINPKKTKPLSSVADTIVVGLKTAKTEEIIDEIANKIEDLSSQGLSIEEIAEQLSLQPKKYEKLSNQRPLSNDPNNLDLSNEASFIKATFSTNEGELSFLEQTQDGGYFILSVDKIEEEKIKPFDEVKDTVQASWLKEQKNKKSHTKAKEITDKVAQGSSFLTLSKDFNLSVKTSESFKRTGEGIKDNALPHSIVEKTFDLNIGQAHYAVHKQGYIVAIVKNITPSSEETNEEGLETLTKNIKDELSSDIISTFLNEHRDEVGVKVYSNVIDDIFYSKEAEE